MATEGGSQVVLTLNTEYRADIEDPAALVMDSTTLMMDSTSLMDSATLAEDSSEFVKCADHESSTGTKRPQAEDDSLWRKLPGEIRNAIYELLSVPSPLDPSDGICIRYGRWCSREDPLAHYHRWEEPGLLMAAKWIRLEAQQIYYQTPIHIAVSTGETARTCEWLRTIAATINNEGNKSLGSVTVRLTDCDWDDIETWIALASLVRDHEFGAELRIKKGEGRWNPSTYDQRKGEIKSRHRNMAAALKEVVAGGARARRDAWSNDELEAAYSYWVEAMLVMRRGQCRRPFHQRGKPQTPRMEKEKQRAWIDWYKAGRRTAASLKR
ncbi:hypothetical protein LTR10_006161 [Elasticomyces elasticus]|nr:hypothetical protein LTR10_006161 [Elasticomyces elasticus]KAK4966789.1 hypothetical protein LTR42_011100 [Elasticomyces elasticus]